MRELGSVYALRESMMHVLDSKPDLSRVDIYENKEVWLCLETSRWYKSFILNQIYSKN